MNAYTVKTSEMRAYTEPVMDDGSGPRILCWPMSPVVAETPGQAKKLFLDEFSHQPRSGVETDDWTSLRVRLLYRDVPLPRGVREDDHALWARIHEIEDHHGRPCDCPIDEEMLHEWWNEVDPR